MCFLEESYEKMQKIKFWKFWERHLFEIREYAFNLQNSMCDLKLVDLCACADTLVTLYRPQEDT